MKISTSSIKSLFEYGLLLALIKISGGARYEEHYAIKLIILAAISFIYMLSQYKKLEIHVNNFNKTFFSLMAIVGFTILVPVINGVSSYSTYVGVLLQIFIGLFVAMSIDIDELKRKYINLMIFLSIMSLIGFAMTILTPTLITKLPLYNGLSASYRYYDAFFFDVPVARGYSSGVTVFLNRNSGLCWEPGCFQAFVSLALLLLLDNIQITEVNKRKAFCVFVFLITLFTTFSVAAMACIIILLCFYYGIFRNCFSVFIPDKRFSSFLFFVLLIGAAVFLILNSTVFNRLQNIVSGTYAYSFAERLDLNKLKYILTKPDGSINILGMSFEKAENYFKLFANSIVYAAVCLGTPFALLIASLHIQAGKRIVFKRFVYSIILLICFCNEGLFYKAMFMAITFSGCLFKDMYYDNYGELE